MPNGTIPTVEGYRDSIVIRLRKFSEETNRWLIPLLSGQPYYPNGRSEIKVITHALKQLREDGDEKMTVARDPKTGESVIVLKEVPKRIEREKKPIGEIIKLIF